MPRTNRISPDATSLGVAGGKETKRGVIDRVIYVVDTVHTTEYLLYILYVLTDPDRYT